MQKFTHTLQILDPKEDRIIKDIMCYNADDADRIKRILHRVLVNKLNKEFSYRVKDLSKIKEERESKKEVKEVKEVKEDLNTKLLTEEFSKLNVLLLGLNERITNIENKKGKK